MGYVDTNWRRLSRDRERQANVLVFHSNGRDQFSTEKDHLGMVTKLDRLLEIIMNGKTLSPDDHLRISTLDLFGELVNKISYLNHKIEIIYSFFAYLIIVFLVT